MLTNHASHALIAIFLRQQNAIDECPPGREFSSVEFFNVHNMDFQVFMFSDCILIVVWELK